MINYFTKIYGFSLLRIISITLMLAWSNTALTQWTYFEVSTTNSSYSNLSGENTITGPGVWTDVYQRIPIGFDFFLIPGFATPYDSVTIKDNGTIIFFQDNLTSVEFWGYRNLFMDRGFGSGLSASPISYKLEGTPGSRILKIQWRNSGFKREYDSTGVLSSFANFQLWLLEEGSCFEVHVGPKHFTNEELLFPFIAPAPGIGFYLTSADQQGCPVYHAELLTGDPLDPEITTGWSMNGPPDMGTVYHFCRPTLGFDEVLEESEEVVISPNPFRQSTELLLKTSSYFGSDLLIFDAKGTLVMSIENIQSNSTLIDRGSLENGIYFYQLSFKNRAINSGKILISD
ncbi:MAG: hypothetical protein ACI837_001830 [Crocinitomicaceae bacterium]|jgi:hypothetical protein